MKSYLIFCYLSFPILDFISFLFHYRMQEKKFPPLICALKIHFIYISTYTKWIFSPFLIWFEIPMTFWYIHLINNNKTISSEKLVENTKEFLDKMKDKLKDE